MKSNRMVGRARETLRLLIIGLIILISSLSAIAQNALQLEVLGVDGPLKKNVLALLESEGMKDFSNEDIQLFVANAPTQVKKALEPLGYFRARVKTNLKYNHDTSWFLTIYIKPGEPLPLRQLDLKITGSGLKDPAFQRLLADFPLQIGKTFSTADYNNAKNSLLNTARERGYLAAKMQKAEIIINLQTYSAAITLHFDTGERYRFGNLTFSSSPLNKNFLARFAPFHPGDYYESEKVQQLQRNLNNSGYFRRVFVNPTLKENSKQVVPLFTKLTPLPAHQYTLGGGFGTDTGIRGLLGYELRPINQYGHTFKSTILASQLTTTLQADYVIPGPHPATDRYVFSAMIDHQEQLRGESDLQKMAVSHITKRTHWERTISLALQRERSFVRDQPPFTQIMLLPSIDISRNTEDDPVRPTRGTQVSFAIVGTPNLFGNAPFLQGTTHARLIYPVFEKNQLVFRGGLGYTLMSNINDLPLSLQFFSGGANSVRGYEFGTIGPGTHMFLGSMEYRQHVKGDWYGAAFIDVGSASSHFFKNLHRGPGIGAVWLSPIGPVSLTLAKGLDSPSRPLLLQFSMGVDS